MSGTYLGVTFQAYLEAKFSVDTRSMNTEVAREFSRRLQARESPVLLDVGCGTGAVARRLVDLPIRGVTTYTGLDADRENLSAAYRACTEYFKARGLSTEERRLDRRGETRRVVEVETSRGRCEVSFVSGDLFAPPESVAERSYDAITAHALLDVLPLRTTVDSLVGRLRPGGMLYSAINYDGTTVLLPEADDDRFERRLLSVYDRSMDDRVVHGTLSGGSTTGRKLYRTFSDAGLVVVGFGASDWSLFPFGGSYDPDQRTLVTAMVEMIAEEGTRHEEIDADRLDRWYRLRSRQAACDELTLVVHQTDILGALDLVTPPK